MPGRHVTLTNIVVGMAQLWTSPMNTAMVADTIDLDVDYPTPWVPVGATEQGIQFHKQPTTQDIDIEEQSLPALVVVTRQDVQIVLTQAEDTIANQKLAYGGGTMTTVAPGTTQPGITQLALSDTLDQLAAGFDGINPFGFFRRVYVPSVISVANVQTNYRRAAAPRLYPTTLRAVCPPSAIIIKDKTAPATAGAQYASRSPWITRTLEEVLEAEGVAA